MFSLLQKKTLLILKCSEDAFMFDISLTRVEIILHFNSYTEDLATFAV